MKITDLKASATTEVGDTILSSNDMSKKYIDRTNEQTLNKLEYPKLWETYKKSTGDRFVDRRVTDNSLGQITLDFIETENSYMFLDFIKSTVSNFKFFNKSMNLLSTVSTGFGSDSNSSLRMTGDNNCVVVYTNTSKAFYYSNNFNIDNQEIGTFTSKTMPSLIRNITFINDYFIIEQVYTANDSIIYKINKNELNKLDLITGVFATDKLLDIVLFDYETFRITNNLGLTSLAYDVGQDVTFLENGDIFLYCNTDKIVAKTNQSNPYFLEIYENLNSIITTGNIVSTNSYKNSFIMTFKKLNSNNSHVIILINDNGLKIKHDSSTNTNIFRGASSAFIFFIDFINKRLINGYNDNIGFYNSFSMNNVKKDTGEIFNLTSNPLYLQFNSEGSSDQKTTKNKNPIFMTLKSTTLTLENGSNAYDKFRADFTLGEFPDNFTMPAITANTQDKYWTKKG